MRGHWYTVVAIAAALLLALAVFGAWHSYQDGRQQAHRDSCRIAGAYLDNCP